VIILEVEAIDVTAIAVAIISAGSSIASAIILTRGQREKKAESKSLENASKILLIACVAFMAWRHMRINTAGAAAAGSALACMSACALHGERRFGKRTTRQRHGLFKSIYYVSSSLLIASFVVITWRNPVAASIASLCCVVVGVSAATFAIHRGSTDTIYRILLSISAILFIGGIVSVVTLVIVPGAEETAIIPKASGEQPISPDYEEGYDDGYWTAYDYALSGNHIDELFDIPAGSTEYQDGYIEGYNAGWNDGIEDYREQGDD